VHGRDVDDTRAVNRVVGSLHLSPQRTDAASSESRGALGNKIVCSVRYKR